MKAIRYLLLPGPVRCLAAGRAKTVGRVRSCPTYPTSSHPGLAIFADRLVGTRLKWQRTMRSFVLLLVFVLGMGCGIPEQVHTQTVRDLEKCRQDLQNARNDLGATLTQLDEERSRNVEVDRPKTEDPQAAPKDLDALKRAREATTRRHAQEKRLTAALKPLADKGALALDLKKNRLVV